MTHPEWAIQHKKPGTGLRNIKGRYYLYKVTSVWDKDEKRTKKKTLGMIGTITKEEGLIPKGTYRRGRKAKTSSEKRNVTTKEYGASKCVMHLTEDILSTLKELFPDTWQVLYVLSVNRLLHKSPLKNIESLYEESYLSEEFGNIDLNKNALTKFMQDIGKDRDKIAHFMKRFVSGSELIAFDSTHIIPQFQNIGLCQKGYSPADGSGTQANLLYMFPMDKEQPSYYRLFPGNVQGVKALKLCITESNTNKNIIISDEGFFSEQNLQLLEDTKIPYILPLKRSSKYIDYNRLNTQDYDSAFDGHFFCKGEVVFYSNMEIKDGYKVVTFTDEHLALEEKKTYLECIEEKCDGYSMEGFKAKLPTFGTISVITNCVNYEARKIYESYKSRTEIETVFNAYKNLSKSDKAYIQSDESMEAWFFISHIATIMHYRVFNLLKSNNLLNFTSPKDLLSKLTKVNKLKINGKWYTSEINSKSLKLFRSLQIPIA